MPLKDSLFLGLSNSRLKNEFKFYYIKEFTKTSKENVSIFKWDVLFKIAK